MDLIRIALLLACLYMLARERRPQPLPVEYRWNLATPYAPRVAFSLS